MKLRWDNWIYGLGSAIIGGGSGSVVGGITSAIVFKVDVTTWRGAGQILAVMAIQFIVAGAFSMFFFLKQSPLPAVETTVTDTLTVTKTTTSENKTETTP